MFNNRFNSTKKDPLVEAVQIAMQDGEIRRQAVAQVNEAFGVFNRNAVIREHLAAYDAAIEEAYECMKEGNKENKEKKRDVEASTGAAYKKMGFDGRGSKGRHPENKRHDDIGLGRKVMKFGEEAYECMKEASDTGESDARKTVTSSKEAKEKVFAKHKERMKKLDDPKADYSKMREKMVGKGKDLETTRKIVGEGNDGNLANNYPPYDKVTRGDVIAGATGKDQMGGKKKKMEEEQIDEISKKLALKAMKKSDERGEEEYDRDMTSDRLSDPKTHWDRAKRLRGHMKRKFGNKTIKTGGTDNLSPKSYEQGGGERRRADKLKKGPRAGMISARHRDKLKDNIKYSLGKHKKPNLPEETQIDEIKVSTAYSYAGKKMEKERKGLLPGDHNPTSKTELKNMRNAAERTDKDYYKKRGFKKMEEGLDIVDRTSDKTIGSNSSRLSDLASDLQNKKIPVNVPPSIKEAAYSAKAARAGKDIGKPGKSFSKIAKSAAERYGSEERGKKVAGAILKRIRAKHMKEDSSFNAALLEFSGKPAGLTPLAPRRGVGKISYAQVTPRPATTTGSGTGATTPAAPPAPITGTAAAAKPSGYDNIASMAINPSAAKSAMDSAMARSAARASGTTATPTSTVAPKPAPTPVKSVQTKGGAYPVFSKGSEPATSFKAAFDKAYAEKPGGTFKWKAAGETGPEREYKAVKAGETPAKTTAAPASTGTNASDIDRPTANPTTPRSMPSNMTGDSSSTAPSTSTPDPGAIENEKRKQASEKNAPINESVVNVGGNKYRIV